MRVQHIVYEQLVDSLTRYKAIAAAGAIVDVRTGEVIAMVSLPDYDPNNPASAFEPVDGKKDQRFNRITSGIFELGSTFKTITIAGALDSGLVKITIRSMPASASGSAASPSTISTASTAC
jgi:cell division protein FtsI (penicillin-binding protein 3)